MREQETKACIFHQVKGSEERKLNLRFFINVLSCDEASDVKQYSQDIECSWFAACDAGEWAKYNTIKEHRLNDQNLYPNLSLLLLKYQSKPKPQPVPQLKKKRERKQCCQTHRTWPKSAVSVSLFCFNLFSLFTLLPILFNTILQQ